MRRYPEPPWTYSPKEVNEWLNAVYGMHKCRKSKVEKEKKWLKNVEIDVDLDVEKEIKEPANLIVKILYELTGREKIEEHFELLPTIEIVLRALFKAGYKKAGIKIDGKEIKAEKIKNAIKDLAKIKGIKEAKIIAINDGKAIIKISRIHPKKRHSLEIRIDKIKEKNLQKFLIYIRKRLKGKYFA